jgi:hypothetical protein
LLATKNIDSSSKWYFGTKFCKIESLAAIVKEISAPIYQSGVCVAGGGVSNRV